MILDSIFGLNEASWRQLRKKDKMLGGGVGKASTYIAPLVKHLQR